jgi:hypothetical protein
MIAKMRDIRSRDKSFSPVVVHCRFINLDSQCIVIKARDLQVIHYTDQN